MKLFRFINLMIIACLFLFIISCPDNADPGEEEDNDSPPVGNGGQWPKRLGGTDYDYGFAIKTDSAGNVYTTGYLRSSADFNNDGVLSGTGGELPGWMQYYDIFIVKYNSSGAYQWSKRLGGTGNDRGHDAALDTGNNLYITGYVTYEADLNGDNDNTDKDAESSIGFGGSDIILVKFDSAGSYQWSWRLGGTMPDQGEGLAADPDNNIFLTGYMFGSANMKGDVTDDIIDLGYGLGSNNIILVKFYSSGAYQWSKRIGGAGYDTGGAVAAELSGNVIVTGLVS